MNKHIIDMIPHEIQYFSRHKFVLLAKSDGPGETAASYPAFERDQSPLWLSFICQKKNLIAKTSPMQLQHPSLAAGLV